MQTDINLASIYRKAPELLLDKLAQVNSVLSKQNQKTESYRFWKGVSDVMKFAWGYMNDFHWIIKENELLKAENDFMKHRSRELLERLSEYETIKGEILAGTLKDTVERVNKYLDERHNAAGSNQ